MRVLVAGGAGFIGSHYVRTMLSGGFPGYEDAEITVVDKLTYAGNLANLPKDHPRLTFVQADIRDSARLGRVLAGHQAAVNFAAESHVDRSLDIHTAAFVETNVLGTQGLLEACLRAGVPTIVQVSTDEVYGSIEAGSWTEDMPPLPNSPYAASKAGGDLVARSYWRTHGLDVRITRASNTFGPYQYIEKLIPLFITNLLSGEPVPLYGTGRNVREWVHVDDHCQAVHLVLTRGRGGEIYNVGGAAALSNREVTARLLELCDADWSMVRFVEDRKGHDFRYSLDDTKIRKALGYEPRRRFDEALAETVAWYRDNPGYWKPMRSEG